MMQMRRRDVHAEVDRELVDRLKAAEVHGFLTTVRSVRLRKYLETPNLLMRDGWRLDASPEVSGAGTPRCYRVGDLRTGQQLLLDRGSRTATLKTFFRSRVQVIDYDLGGDQVLSNRLAPA